MIIIHNFQCSISSENCVKIILAEIPVNVFHVCIKTYKMVAKKSSFSDSNDLRPRPESVRPKNPHTTSCGKQVRITLRNDCHFS